MVNTTPSFPSGLASLFSQGSSIRPGDSNGESRNGTGATHKQATSSTMTRADDSVRSDDSQGVSRVTNILSIKILSMKRGEMVAPSLDAKRFKASTAGMCGFAHLRDVSGSSILSRSNTAKPLLVMSGFEDTEFSDYRAIADGQEAAYMARRIPLASPLLFAQSDDAPAFESPCRTAVSDLSDSSRDSLAVVEPIVANQKDAWHGESINGNMQQIDTGRFPLRSPIDPSQRHPWYPEGASLKILRPESIAQECHRYLTGTDDFRRDHKKNMYCRKLQSVDIQCMQGDADKLTGQIGTFAACAIKKGTFMGVYEGVMITSSAEWEARLAAVSEGNRNMTEVIDNLNLYSWSLRHAHAHLECEDYPQISAFSSPNDRFPVRCVLSNINTAIRVDQKGTPSYIKALLNVKPVYIQTNIGKRNQLERDMLAYVTTRDIAAGQQLLVDYGPAYLRVPSMRGAPSQSGDASSSSLSINHSMVKSRTPNGVPYDYDSTRDGCYPIRIFSAENGEVTELGAESLIPSHRGLRSVQASAQQINPVIVHDDPQYDHVVGTMRFLGQNPSCRCFGTTVKQLAHAAKEFIKMDTLERERFFRSLFNVENENVYAKKNIERGTFLGLYAGIMFRYGDGKALASLLGKPLAELDEHAINMYEHDDTDENYLITAQGAGNLLQMVDFGVDWWVDIKKVSIFSESIGLPVPDAVLFAANKRIPEGTCLTMP